MKANVYSMEGEVKEEIGQATISSVCRIPNALWK